jgi:hypothetical protein
VHDVAGKRSDWVPGLRLMNGIQIIDNNDAANKTDKQKKALMKPITTAA